MQRHHLWLWKFLSQNPRENVAKKYLLLCSYSFPQQRLFQRGICALTDMSA